MKHGLFLGGELDSIVHRRWFLGGLPARPGSEAIAEYNRPTDDDDDDNEDGILISLEENTIA